MEGDRLSGGIAPLIFKLGSRQMWVVRLSALATLLPDKQLSFFIEFYAGWALELVWMFWRRDSSLAHTKFWSPYLLSMLAHSCLKVIPKEVLIKWNWRFGLDVFNSWQFSCKASLNMVISFEVLWKRISCSESCWKCDGWY